MLALTNNLHPQRPHNFEDDIMRAFQFGIFAVYHRRESDRWGTLSDLLRLISHGTKSLHHPAIFG